MKAQTPIKARPPESTTRMKDTLLPQQPDKKESSQEHLSSPAKIQDQPLLFMLPIFRPGRYDPL